MTADQILRRLRALRSDKNIAGMARFGISGGEMLGIPVPVLRTMAKETGRDQKLSLALWKTGVHEARLLAAFTGDPAQVTPRQMDAWVKEFDSWDVCDQVCGNLFDRTPYAYDKAIRWARRKEEFVRRAGFALMATLAVHDKKADDARFLVFFPLIETYATDDRNFVKKAVNWALRQMGKRSAFLKAHAMRTGKRVLEIDAPSARWIARDALRELGFPRSRRR